MRYLKIGVCGAPLCGKTTFLSSLAKVTGSTRIRTWSRPWESRTRLDVVLPDLTIVFVTISGLFFPERRDLVLELLSDASMVIYMATTAPTQNGEQVYFDLYHNEAVQIDKTWKEIPWLFLLNSFEEKNDNPFSRLIPKEYQSSVMNCNTKSDSDVGRVWDEILNKVNSHFRE